MHMHEVIPHFIQMSHFTSLMHHFNAPRTRMRSPDQCSIYIMPVHSSLPPFASSYYRLLEQKVPAGYNAWTHAQNVLTLGPHMNICMTMGLHACQYSHILINTYNTQHCMNGEADNSRFVSMYVYMHLAFKEF